MSERFIRKNNLNKEFIEKEKKELLSNQRFCPIIKDVCKKRKCMMYSIMVGVELIPNKDIPSLIDKIAKVFEKCNLELLVSEKKIKEMELRK